jgi:polyferredoxin
MLADGEIRNGYTIKLLNKRHEERYFRLSVAKLPGARVDTVGLARGTTTLSVPADSLRSFRVLVTAPRGALHDRSRHIEFVATDVADGTTTEEDATFQGPHDDDRARR